jgi:Cd2+/Zn2+-exporting ATPase
MACTDDCDTAAVAERPRLLANPQVRAAILSWLCLIAGLVAGGFGTQFMANVAFAAAILSGAFYFGREAAEELLKKRIVGVELLMSTAVIAAAALGHWREGALVAALF